MEEEVPASVEETSAAAAAEDSSHFQLLAGHPCLLQQAAAAVVHVVNAADDAASCDFADAPLYPLWCHLQLIEIEQFKREVLTDSRNLFPLQ